LAWQLGEVERGLKAHAHAGNIRRAGAFVREHKQRTKGDKHMHSHGAHTKLRVQDEKGLAGPWRMGEMPSRALNMRMGGQRCNLRPTDM
jgi:hypothetical protein